MNLKGNKFGEPDWSVIFDALRDNPQNKIAKWNLKMQRINPTISKSLAAYMAVSGSLTEVHASLNRIPSLTTQRCLLYLMSPRACR